MSKCGEMFFIIQKRSGFGICLLLILCLKSYGQGYNDLVISEIMTDPTPVIGLPAVEYLELYNRSGRMVSLKNWKLKIGTRTAVFPDSVIFPGEYLILCNKTNADSLKQFGRVIPLSTFSLPNDAGTISLYQPANSLIFSVDYDLSWWPVGKKEGGYALEMIDTRNPCGGGNNWEVSKNVLGGTPGKINSILRNNPDTAPPILERVNISASNELRIIANERLDSLTAISGTLVELPGRKILKKKLESPQFRVLIITLDSPLAVGEKYNLSVKNLSDCTGNLLRQADFTIGLPSKADSGDVVLNEILFNPPEGGVDFVEIYNRSQKYIDLKNWALGNVKGGEPDVFRVITTDNFILVPFEYMALTVNPDIVKALYPKEKPGNFLKLTSMPAYANTVGGVILKNQDGMIYDRFDYNEDMHDPLITDRKGVSLEKSDTNISSQTISNWHSAAVSAGNATPGYANSQIETATAQDIFEIEPDAFVADNRAGNNAKIKYKLQRSGKIATIRIFDINGRLIKNLIRNQLIGTNGEISWDGSNENGVLVPTGYYLVLIDIFEPTGEKAQYKRKVVVVKN